MDRTRFERIDPTPYLEQVTPDEDVEMPTVEEPGRLIIAVDFGTTFSSVAYARLRPGVALSLMDVRCIDSYPDERPGTKQTGTWERREDVPTELWYQSSPTSTDGESQSIEGHLQKPEQADSDTSDEVESSSDEEPEFEQADQPTAPQNPRQERKSPVFWGFEVQRHLKRIDVPKDGTKRITRFKLMLDKNSSETQDIRMELRSTIAKLKKSKLIEDETDVISDYLERLFDHTRKELQRASDHDTNPPIEFVLCIPAVWPSRACRIMQTAMARAVERSGLGNLKNGSIDNLFLVSEPEAAAACVLESNLISIGETIVVLDAGGGTVDAVTYQITESFPLRLRAEITTPGSELCGASYINQRFQKLLRKRLKNETYLEKNGKTIESIIEGLTMIFENEEKRIIDVTDSTYALEPVYIDDLKHSVEKRFIRNRLEISQQEMKRMFRGSLKGTASVLRDQLNAAKSKGYVVQKVLLIGGFGQSPSLQNYLRRKVTDVETNSANGRISLLTPRTPSTVVARGAVLRAYSKELGPERITLCSYGFLRSEPYEPESYDAHKSARPKIDRADGERYIDSTIDWLIKKGDVLPTNKVVTMEVKHTFKLAAKSFLCQEQLYVSDDCHESHYRRTHHMNRGAELAGQITVDMRFLKDQDLIQPERPSVFSKQTASHWAVRFDLVMIIDGRNLQYEARWPSSKDTEMMSQRPKVLEQGQICIAAAFQSGTD